MDIKISEPLQSLTLMTRGYPHSTTLLTLEAFNTFTSRLLTTTFSEGANKEFPDGSYCLFRPTFHASTVNNNEKWASKNGWFELKAQI